MKTVLVNWLDIPENQKFIILKVKDEELELLKSFHNHYVNDINSQKIQYKILAFFYDESYLFKFKQETGPIENQLFDLIITTGFIL